MSGDDLFPGFDRRTVPGEGVDIFCRMGGSGPPVLLLHGFPQTHLMWHAVAPALAQAFTVVVADLRGYGKSALAPVDAGHAAYAKRAMARDFVAVMRALGHDRFAVVGHDRGARVAYRMAFDLPAAVTRLAVLDILPTWNYWQRLDRTSGLAIYHWMFLAQPPPFPETLIGGAPDDFLEHTLRSWAGPQGLSAFDERALQAYRVQIRDADRRRSLCDDYRAGATVDVAHDEEDRAAGRRIGAPLMALWGTSGIARGAVSPIDVWRDWADDVSGRAVDCGHFIPEEAPEATLAALLPFLRGE